MNKDALVSQVADKAEVAKSQAQKVVEALTDTIKGAVAKGEKVALTGFGTFEKRVRGPRTARNPRTGEAIKVGKTNVPAFKAGSGFKEAVASGGKKSATKKGAAKSSAKKSTAKKSTARSR